MPFDLLRTLIEKKNQVVDRIEALTPEKFRYFLSRKRCVIKSEDLIVVEGLDDAKRSATEFFTLMLIQSRLHPHRRWT